MSLNNKPAMLPPTAAIAPSLRPPTNPTGPPRAPPTTAPTIGKATVFKFAA